MRRVVPVMAIAAAAIFSIAVYSRLPDVMPIHWGVSGEPDGFAPKPWAVLLLPFIALVVYGILVAVRRHAWRHAGDAAFVRASETTIALVVSFLSFVHIVVLGSALGWSVDVPRFIVLGIGVMLILLGFQMVEMPRNPWFGIRTPWTLRSDRVWQRTHHVGSRVMVLCGVAMGFSTLLTAAWMVSVVLLTALVMVVSTIGYSYWIARSD
ncbi:MAG TPA: SdpI family protein [Gemmatimonadaceae bacterium]|jgi:uncharacterized membrane protein|nr:SdpI family protein [Gemmatimonadaceae bacterium]